MIQKWEWSTRAYENTNVHSGNSQWEMEVFKECDEYSRHWLGCTRELIHYSQFRGGLMAGSADPPILKVPTQIYSIYSSLEEFRMPENKEDNRKIDLKMTRWYSSRLIIMRFDERAMVSRPDLWLGTQGHMHLWIKWTGIRKATFLRFLAMKSQCTVIIKPVREVLMEAKLAINGDAVIDDT